VQEQMTSSFMDSPLPPHLEAPFFGADLIPSGRLRRYRHSPGGLEEEVHVHPSHHPTYALQQNFVLCLVRFACLHTSNRISSFLSRAVGLCAIERGSPRAARVG
jgi:hypothetical protein